MFSGGGTVRSPAFDRGWMGCSPKNKASPTRAEGMYVTFESAVSAPPPASGMLDIGYR
ncbi:hypothetical protein M2266_000934 [Streptomyces sp. SPB162]|nr:hypothetical protein [Streptomyces sp. SPB162]